MERTFTCRVCAGTWTTCRKGRFTRCPECKKKQARTRRTKVCGYRNCEGVFYDETPKSSQRYCCGECARREKAFRSGKASDEGYFRTSSNLVKCQTCGDHFTPIDRGGRCKPCRKEARQKVCVVCSSPFQDDSKKNTRKKCSPCATPKRRRARVTKTPRELGLGNPYPRGSTSWVGRLGELLFLRGFPRSTDSNVEYGKLSPFDGVHPQFGRVQVKTSCQEGRWVFPLDGVADTFFLVGLSWSDYSLKKAWLAPSKELPSTLKVMNPGSREYTDQEKRWEVTDLSGLQTHMREILGLPTPTPPKKRVRYARTWLGRIGERIYSEENPDSLHVSKNDPTSPFDFRDPDGLRVDVGARTLSERGKHSRWTFHCSPGSDVFHFYGFDRHATKILAVYRVPAKAVLGKGFSVRLGSGSKWDAYRVPVPVLTEFPEEIRTLIEMAQVTRRSFDALSEERQDAFAKRVLSHYRRGGFPHPEHVPDEIFQAECDTIRQTEFPQDREFPIQRGCTHTLTAYMPHRFEARNANSDFSAATAFASDERLLRAIRFCLRHGKPDVSPNGVRGSLTALNRTPGHFNPKLAYALVKNFCPSGGTVFDPCAGWGGRLLGTVLADCRYVGVEPEERTYRALCSLGERLRNLVGAEPPLVHHAGIQDLMLPGEFADFALTSPPFWGQEVYGEYEQGTLSEWVAGFLAPMMEKTYGALRPGAAFVVHAADFSHQGHPVALVSLIREEALAQGFLEESALKVKKASFGSRQKKNRWDPLLVFRRPSR